MKCLLIDHQSKGRNLGLLLNAGGHDLVSDLDEAEVLFAHTDAAWHNNELDLIETFAQSGRKVILYPHGAQPSIEYDGLQEASEHVSCKLVTGPGHKEVLKRYGYPRPVMEAGWFYCPIVPFRPVKEVRRVLFAPLHPWADGQTILDGNLLLNKKVFRTLLRDLPAETELHVSYFGDEESNGLHEGTRAILTRKERLDNSYDLIDGFDLVVSVGTFAYLAVARGKPTIMFGQRSHAVSDGGDRIVDHWDDYGEYMRYPLDMSDWPLPMLVSKACEGGNWLSEWKRLFIGRQMTAQGLTTVLHSVTGKTQARRAQKKTKKRRKQSARR